jgi:hypothetical protein
MSVRPTHADVAHREHSPQPPPQLSKYQSEVLKLKRDIEYRLQQQVFTLLFFLRFKFMNQWQKLMDGSVGNGSSPCCR